MIKHEELKRVDFSEIPTKKNQSLEAFLNEQKIIPLISTLVFHLAQIKGANIKDEDIIFVREILDKCSETENWSFNLRNLASSLKKAKRLASELQEELPNIVEKINSFLKEIEEQATRKMEDENLDKIFLLLKAIRNYIDSIETMPLFNIIKPFIGDYLKELDEINTKIVKAIKSLEERQKFLVNPQVRKTATTPLPVETHEQKQFTLAYFSSQIAALNGSSTDEKIEELAREIEEFINNIEKLKNIRNNTETYEGLDQVSEEQKKGLFLSFLLCIKLIITNPDYQLTEEELKLSAEDIKQKISDTIDNYFQELGIDQNTNLEELRVQLKEVKSRLEELKKTSKENSNPQTGTTPLLESVKQQEKRKKIIERIKEMLLAIIEKIKVKLRRPRKCSF